MLIWHTKSRIYLRVLSPEPPDPSLAKTPCCKSIPCYITYYITYYIACVLTSTASLTEMPSLLPVPALGDHSAESPIHPRRSLAYPSWAQLEQGQCHRWRGGVRPIWVHSIVFPVPVIHWVHWLWQRRGSGGRGHSLNWRGTQSHRLWAYGMCRKQFILKEIYLTCYIT